MSEVLQFLENIKEHIEKLETENMLLKRKVLLSDYIYGELLQNKYYKRKNKNGEHVLTFDESFIINLFKLYDPKQDEQNKYLYEIMNRFTDTIFEYMYKSIVGIVTKSYRRSEKTIMELFSDHEETHTETINVYHLGIIMKFINHIYDNKDNIVDHNLFYYYPDMVKSSTERDPLDDVYYIVDTNIKFNSIRKLIGTTFKEFIKLLPQTEGKVKARDLLNTVMNTSINTLLKILEPNAGDEDEILEDIDTKDENNFFYYTGRQGFHKRRTKDGVEYSIHTSGTLIGKLMRGRGYSSDVLFIELKPEFDPEDFERKFNALTFEYSQNSKTKRINRALINKAVNAMTVRLKA